MKNKSNYFIKSILFGLVLLAAAMSISAQTTEFTYQGRLTDSGIPATATYDFEFHLYDENNALLGTINRLGVSVANGAFTVALDFGAQFPGAARSLEIGVKPAGGGSYTTLAPRQPLTSAPYSIRARDAGNADNAIQFMGQNPENFVRYDAGGNVAVAANLSVGGNLSLSGSLSLTGTVSVSVVDAATEYRIGGQRVLRTPATDNLIAGINAGPPTGNAGTKNTYAGTQAGTVNLNGDENVLIGYQAGKAGSNMDFSVMVGALAGERTTSGQNTFVGYNAGPDNTNGLRNTFLGRVAGDGNVSGDDNTAVGSNTKLGSNSSFVTVVGSGADVGGSGTVSSTAMGANARVIGNGIVNATAIGAGSTVSTSNTIALGRPDGSDKVRVPGLGTAGNTSVCRNASNELSTCAPGNVEPGSNNYIQNSTTTQSGANFSIGGSANIDGGFSVGSNVGIGGNTTMIGNLTVNGTLTADLPDGDPGYIQNNTGFPQEGSFAILGNGSMMGNGLIGGTLQVNGNQMSLGLNRFLSVAGTQNTFVGHNVAPTNTGADNSFFGFNSGNANTTGADNSFFGSDAGGNNTTGAGNSFFGSDAGDSNTNGSENSFFGRSAGGANSSGIGNTFVGYNAGATNTTRGL